MDGHKNTRRIYAQACTVSGLGLFVIGIFAVLYLPLHTGSGRSTDYEAQGFMLGIIVFLAIGLPGLGLALAGLRSARKAANNEIGADLRYAAFIGSSCLIALLALQLSGGVDALLGSSVKIKEVVLEANPAEYSGPCPVAIRFVGQIIATGGHGHAQYRFSRSDGDRSPILAVAVEGPGANEVTTMWVLGKQGRQYSGWIALQVLDPQEMNSKQAAFKIECR